MCLMLLVELKTCGVIYINNVYHVHVFYFVLQQLTVVFLISF